MNIDEFEKMKSEYERTGFPGLCDKRDEHCLPDQMATEFIKLSEKEIYLYCKMHAPDDALPLHPTAVAVLLSPEKGAPAVIAATGGFAKLRSKLLSDQFGIRLESTGARQNLALTRVILQTLDASPANPYLVTLDQHILAPFAGTDVGATGVLTSDNTNVANNDTVTIRNKVYTFKTTLTPTEGEVLRGGSADASLLNLIRAINHTGTPNTDYKCAAANPDVTAASSVTAHAFQVTAIVPGVSTVATTETSAHLSWGAVTLVGGSTAGQFDLVERDSVRQVFDGASAGGTGVLTSATMNWQTGDVDKPIKVGINPGRWFRILSRQSVNQVTLDSNITLPSIGLTLTMDGEIQSTIATKDGFTDGVTVGGHSHLEKVITADKVYSVIFVPGVAGDGIYTASVRALYHTDPIPNPESQ